VQQIVVSVILNCNNTNMLQGGGRIGRIVMVVIPIHVKSAQIQEQEAEPQQIVAQRLLSCLHYPVPIKSSTEDLTNVINAGYRIPVSYVVQVSTKVGRMTYDTSYLSFHPSLECNHELELGCLTSTKFVHSLASHYLGLTSKSTELRTGRSPYRSIKAH
jgi:hypothetical protein